MSMIVQELIITSVWHYAPLRKKKNEISIFYLTCVDGKLRTGT